MTEVRPINEPEAEDFLLLLCEAFDLDFSRAKGVFFREPMFELNRKWALFSGDRIESILTTVPLRFGWGNAIGIAGVATRFSSRGTGLASTLLQEVLKAAEQQDEGPTLLFAKRTELYQEVGFQVLDDVVRARVLAAGDDAQLSGVLGTEEVVDIYQQWAARNPHRLRRDERRWNYWKWNLRVCCPFTSGYLCLEGNALRECIVDEAVPEWPIHNGTEWIGLTSMARQLGVPLGEAEFELHLMGYGFDQVPQMFMTDQF